MNKYWMAEIRIVRAFKHGRRFSRLLTSMVATTDEEAQDEFQERVKETRGRKPGSPIDFLLFKTIREDLGST